MLVVQKFGGSSVADAARLRNVAKIVTDTYKRATTWWWWSPPRETPPTT